MIKRLASFLPAAIQREVRRMKTLADVARGRFTTPEPEFARLHEWISPGDTVLDVGANVGYYTRRMSELVGVEGRVIAFEPVPDTAAILAAISAPLKNVAVMNVAASLGTGEIRLEIPTAASGLPDYFMARATANGDLRVMTIAIDSLQLPRVDFIKIDVEGHELEALRGMRETFARCRPMALVVETEQVVDVCHFLAEFGYEMESRAEGSANLVFNR